MKYKVYQMDLDRKKKKLDNLYVLITSFENIKNRNRNTTSSAKTADII